MEGRWKKAQWIATQMEGDDVEDIYDVILGNITEPVDFVNEVTALASDYDMLAGRARYTREIIGD